MKAGITAAAFAGALALLAGAASADGPSGGDAKHGKALFAQHCALCHGAAAEGAVGPSLQGESKRKNADAISTQIMDPKPPMAKLYPKPLSKPDVEDLVAYILTL